MNRLAAALAMLVAVLGSPALEGAHFAIATPAGWTTVSDPAAAENSVRFAGPVNDSFQANVIVRAQPGAGIGLDDAAKRAFKHSITAGLPGTFTFLDEEETRVGGLPAWRVEYHYTAPGLDVTGYSVLVRGHRHGWVATFLASTPSFQATRIAVDDALDSFQAKTFGI